MAKALAALKALPYSFAPSLLRGHHVERLEWVAREYKVDYDEVLLFLRGKAAPGGGGVPPWVFLYAAGLWCLPCVRFGEAMGPQSAQKEAQSTRQAVALFTAALEQAQRGAPDDFRLLLRAALADAEGKLKQTHKAADHISAAVQLWRGGAVRGAAVDEAWALLLKTIAAVGVADASWLPLLAAAPESCAHHVKAAWDANGCERAEASLKAGEPKYHLALHPLGERVLRDNLVHNQEALCAALRAELAGVLRRLSGERAAARSCGKPFGLDGHACAAVRAAVTMAHQGILAGWVHFDAPPDGGDEGSGASSTPTKAGTAPTAAGPGSPGGTSACPLLLLASLMYCPPDEVAALRLFCRSGELTELRARDDVEGVIHRLELLRYVRCDDVFGSPLNVITDTRLADFYNANPYPVWRHVGTAGVPQFESYKAYLRQYLPAKQHARLPWADGPGEERLLIAGCGSGHQMALALHQYRHTEVVGIDLSTTNLAYAHAQLAELFPGVKEGRPRWAVHEADLTNPLDVGAVGAPGKGDLRFHVIECCGVLHHCEDPAAALKTLMAALSPGGVVVLGVYAAKSCEPVREAIRWLEGRHPQSSAAGPSLDAIKKIREDVDALPSHHPAKRVLLSQLSYYSAAPFRDMLFHPRAHYFTIPQLRDLAAAAGAQLLSMSFDGCGTDIAARLRYSSLAPHDEAMDDWATWEAVEKTGLLTQLPWHTVLLWKPKQ
eukprot:TRINITY_DN4743_c0_g1_i1.p1 TRINITY_DN4743_c0_g1~~TRINITY_DN4743_c0_g1_i1.p1  ORF type:complete len:722 (+),score=251.43 TRINITY_DN4743_c0_g1_i1:79-2244(+)